MDNSLIDEDLEEDLSIWVCTDKTLVEFEKSVSTIIEPVQVVNRKFNIGAIEIYIKEVESQPKSYVGIPQKKYSFEIVIPTTPYLIWSIFDKRVVYALTLGLRTKFCCSYLVSTCSEEFVFYSGTNEPYYLNLNYLACTNGELIPLFENRNNIIELHI